jgi:serine/threonine-protein kinase
MTFIDPSFSKILHIGDQFDQYQIQSYLAQGGMSDIYRAFDILTRREVVIKIPNQSMLGDPAQAERFQRELEVMASLDHPAILKGLGSGVYNRIPYLVTEFIDGKSLRQVMELSGAFLPEKAIPIILKVAEGMAYCHAQGIVHRDLKPENILIRLEDGQPIIMDFGLALTRRSHRVTFSNLTVTLGTPDYMAPEQIEGQRGDIRTDIYALGTILYEMLAGTPPFGGDTPLAVMAQHLNNTAPRLDQVAPKVSPALAAVVARCLQRRPETRYADMPALMEALQNPASADLRLLEPQKQKIRPGIQQSQMVWGILLGMGLMIALIALALLLQTLLP